MVLHSVVLGVVLGMGVIIWVVTWLLLTIVHVQYYCRFDDVDQSGRYLFLTSELVLWWVLTTDCPFFTSEADYLGILKESIDITHLLYIVVVEEEWYAIYLHLHIAEMFVIYLYTLNGWQAFYSELSDVLYPDNTRDFPYILLNIKRYVFSFSIGHYFLWKNNLFFTTLNRKYNKDIWCLLCNSLFTLQSSYIICRLY